MGISMDLGGGLTPRNRLFVHPSVSSSKDQGACNSGYMGAQFSTDGHHTLFWSMSGREEGQIVPVGKYCRYDCYECLSPTTRDFRCSRDDYKIDVGVDYTFTLQMEMQNA